MATDKQSDVYQATKEANRAYDLYDEVVEHPDPELALTLPVAQFLQASEFQGTQTGAVLSVGERLCRVPRRLKLQDFDTAVNYDNSEICSQRFKNGEMLAVHIREYHGFDVVHATGLREGEQVFYVKHSEVDSLALKNRNKDDIAHDFSQLLSSVDTSAITTKEARFSEFMRSTAVRIELTDEEKVARDFLVFLKPLATIDDQLVKLPVEELLSYAVRGQLPDISEETAADVMENDTTTLQDLQSSDTMDAVAANFKIYVTSKRSVQHPVVGAAMYELYLQAAAQRVPRMKSTRVNYLQHLARQAEQEQSRSVEEQSVNNQSDNDGNQAVHGQTLVNRPVETPSAVRVPEQQEITVEPQAGSSRLANNSRASNIVATPADNSPLANYPRSSTSVAPQAANSPLANLARPFRINRKRASSDPGEDTTKRSRGFVRQETFTTEVTDALDDVDLNLSAVEDEAEQGQAATQGHAGDDQTAVGAATGEEEFVTKVSAALSDRSESQDQGQTEPPPEPFDPEKAWAAVFAAQADIPNQIRRPDAQVPGGVESFEFKGHKSDWNTRHKSLICFVEDPTDKREESPINLDRNTTAEEDKQSIPAELSKYKLGQFPPELFKFPKGHRHAGMLNMSLMKETVARVTGRKDFRLCDQCRLNSQVYSFSKKRNLGVATCFIGGLFCKVARCFALQPGRNYKYAYETDTNEKDRSSRYNINDRQDANRVGNLRIPHFYPNLSYENPLVNQP